MILKKLELEGYGPFIEKNTIEFDELNFFCIQGENGSGKSTLIDSISMALWGSPVRARWKELIPEGSQRMRVMLEFEMDGGLIRIERMRGKRSNDILEWTKGEEKEIHSKKAEVNHFVEEKLGLKKEFLQKAFLIQQGEFARILQSGRKEDRQAILDMTGGGVFGTLKNIIGQKREDLEIHLEKLKSLTEGQSEEEMKQALEALKIETAEGKKRQLEIEKEQKKLDKDHKKLSLDLHKYRDYIKKEKTLADMGHYFQENKKRLEESSSLEKALYLLGDWNRLTTYSEQIRKLSQEQDKVCQAEEEAKKEHRMKQACLEKSLSLLKAREASREKHYEEVLLFIEKRDNSAQEYQKIRKQWDEKQKKIRDSQEKVTSIKKELAEKKKKQSTILEEQKKINYRDGALELFRELLPDYWNWKKGKSQMNEWDSEIIVRENKQKELALEKEKKQKKINNLKIELKEIRLKVHENMAFEIRKGLSDGEECPVCLGIYRVLDSENHGHQLEKAAGILKAKEEQLLQVQSDSNRINEEEKVNNKQLEVLLEKFLKEKKTIEQKEIILQSKLENWPLDLEAELKNSEKKQKKYQELESLVRDIHVKIEQSEKEKEWIEHSINEQELEIKALQRGLDEIEKTGIQLKSQIETKMQAMQITKPDSKKAREQLKIFINNLDRFRKDSENQKKELSEIELKLERLQEKMKQIKVQKKNLEEQQSEENISLKKRLEKAGLEESVFTQVEKLSEEDLKQERAKLEEFFTAYQLLEKELELLRPNAEKWNTENQIRGIEMSLGELNRALSQLAFHMGEKQKEESQLKERLEQFIKHQNEQKDILKEYRLLKELENDFRSDRFPAFYVRLILEQILEDANRNFLSKVLSGRYCLALDEEKDRFEVMDSTFQSSRVVETLSGGEQFLIAFAMALSFSRMMGDKIGIFFIDEGFGTLDEENRGLLREIFEVLSREKLRKIGLITHIAEIAEDIPQKIQVKKGENGSFLEVQL